MSYDITIRPDEKFSRSVPREIVAEFVATLPSIRRADSPQFVLDEKPKRWMGISLETTDEEGNCVEKVGRTYDTTNCVRLHIPYAFLGMRPDLDYFPTCFAIANHLGWSVYDEQSGEVIPRDAIASDDSQTQKPWWRFW
jgi:hypothetical protein